MEQKTQIGSDHSFFDVISDAYKAFDFKTPSKTGVCENCCMYKEIEQDFFNPKITHLPQSYLQDWYMAAYDPHQGVPKAIWGYLLPRVLELMALDIDVTLIGLEITFERFPTGDRSQWNDAQWDVLDRFQRAYLDREMMREDEFRGDVICMFALGKWSLSDLWEQIMAYPAAILVPRLWTSWCDRKDPKIRVTAFWGDRETEAISVYASKPLFDRLKALSTNPATDPQLQWQALALASVIRSNAAWAKEEGP